MSVPKNYSGNAFRAGQQLPSGTLGSPPGAPIALSPSDFTPKARKPLPPPVVPAPSVAPPPPPCDCAEETPPETDCGCDELSPPQKRPSKGERAGPIAGLLDMMRGQRHKGFDGEDLLLIGMIALLMNKEGNQDLVLILAMLLLL